MVRPAGKKENCQVGVYLIGVTPAETALLDHGLYLPKLWTTDRAARRKTRVPQEVNFQTKPQIASEQIRRTRAAGHVTFDWITADELYGRDGRVPGSIGTRRPALPGRDARHDQRVDRRPEHADALLVWQRPTDKEPTPR